MPGRSADRDRPPTAISRKVASSSANSHTRSPHAAGAQHPDRRRWRGPGAWTVLARVQLVLGLVLATVGCLTALDVLSVRSLLAASGPTVAWQLAISLHALLAHTGAQVTELALALLGVLIAASSVRSLLGTAGERL